MGPHNSVVQPGIQKGRFGTAINGKSFSGSAANGFKKRLHVFEISSPSRAQKGCCSPQV